MSVAFMLLGLHLIANFLNVFFIAGVGHVLSSQPLTIAGVFSGGLAGIAFLVAGYLLFQDSKGANSQQAR